MAKLRKMLGDIRSEECLALMRLMETQSRETLATWAMDYAEENYLPIVVRRCGGNFALTDALSACRGVLRGGSRWSEAKTAILEVRQMAQGLEADPAAQAAVRAVSTACAGIRTPSNAFGFLLYGAAAVAYDMAGLDRRQEVYDGIAAQELQKACRSLKAVSNPEEPHPVHIVWHC